MRLPVLALLQEVGVEAGARGLLASCFTSCLHDPSEQLVRAYDVAVSWKRALSPSFAIVGWLGGTTHSSAVSHLDYADRDDWNGLSVDAALELVASAPINRSLDVYWAGRLAVAVPITGEADYAPPSVLVTVNATGGLGMKLSPHLRLYAEAGVVIDEGTIGVQGVGGIGLQL